jgi:acetyltransferase-like isoleucine patch superfamily enzyme/dTDP-4-dehydrorhamnose 3,5-epimerase-like enzyme
MTPDQPNAEGVFIHPNAICETGRVGSGTRIWAFAHLLPGAQVGSDCNICDGVFIENDVSVGDRVTIKSGVQLWDGVRLEDDVFVGPNATFTNDPFPRSKQYPESFPQTVVHRGASIGANATILPGISIGSAAMVGAGAVVTRSVPPNAIVVGNPARIVGYADAAGTGVPPLSREAEPAFDSHSTSVRGVTVHRLPRFVDIRGSLVVGEYSKHIPFVPQRFFIVYDVPSRETRGEHAHRECEQFLVCIRGSCAVVADDGRNRQEFTLDSPGVGVYLPPMTWGIQYRYSPDAALLVFASHHYDPDDYIRDYDEFRQLGEG